MTDHITPVLNKYPILGILSSSMVGVMSFMDGLQSLLGVASIAVGLAVGLVTLKIKIKELKSK